MVLASGHTTVRAHAAAIEANSDKVHDTRSITSRVMSNVSLG